MNKSERMSVCIIKLCNIVQLVVAVIYVFRILVVLLLLLHGLIAPPQNVFNKIFSN